MEFGVRELVQFGTLLASLAGAFAVVKSQLTRVMEDLKNIGKELEKLNIRLDETESKAGVFKSQITTLSDINSVGSLANHNREMGNLLARLDVIEKEIDHNKKLHNGQHK
jgi:septal ring factor EnvC (AmiA/AmiB activator)|tara:strand:+ start:267 stop:596 length:330 start_codon:yes stop_codon:yes gene_type:complete